MCTTGVPGNQLAGQGLFVNYQTVSSTAWFFGVNSRQMRWAIRGLSVAVSDDSCTMDLEVRAEEVHIAL